MTKRKRTRLQAGIFLAVGLAILAVAILLVGQKNALFVPTRTYFVYYDDTSGLVPGASVRLAGVDVGTVTSITLPDDPGVKAARVRLLVQERFAERIRMDSLAFIDSKGLLGDKIINLTLGDSKQPVMPEGATIKPGRSVSIETLSKDVQEAVVSVTDVAREAKRLVSGIEGDALEGEVTSITGSLNRILNEVERGEGVVHRLIYDKRLAQEVDLLVDDTRASVRQITSAVARAERVVAEIERGDGTAHEVVYGQDGARLIRELANAADEVENVTRQIREGDGLLHTLVYGEGNTDFLLELNEFAASLNRMAKNMEKGRGTLGALAVDPTVYEDMKSVLGNVERNILLKALIRFTIKNDEIRRSGGAPQSASEARVEN